MKRILFIFSLNSFFRFLFLTSHEKKVEGEADEASTSKVRKFLPTCCTSFTPFDSVRNIKMGPKIMEITCRLEEISAQKAELGLQMLKGQSESRITAQTPNPATPLVYKPGVYGRDEDRRKIVAMLKDGPLDGNLSVVSMVAMGGIGKTTLAGLVYDDDEISKHFAVKAWVCVSEQFDVETITKAVLRDIAPGNNDLQVFHQIQRKLRDELKGKRFLIVLDDLWNETYDMWDSLRSPFLEGAPGSKILVTTRNKNVATMMGGDKNLYELKHLSNNDCWLVFQRHAFEHINVNEHQNLASIGRRIVEKCGGLPLAAKALGGLLRSELRETEWERVLDSKIWDLTGNECEIIPALRLSYNHLPSYLKRCFAYCAIFPKDYEFKQEELILLWMAEGLIQQSKVNRKIEDLGGDYFRELLSRSFFQPSSSNGSRFVMHDLVNDLAQFVAGETCLHLDDKLENDLQCTISKRTHHLSFIRRWYDIFKRFEWLRKEGHLRTFIALPIVSRGGFYLSNKVLEELIPKLRHLRVFSLSGYMISEIPNSFGELKHLRYLNLSNTNIKCLPNSVGDLYNLQTLILSSCLCLTRLPISIGNLINLRHLDVTGAMQLEEMPSQIGKLKDLHILSNFIVGKDNGLKIKEMKNMSHLGGELCISRLQNVVNIQDAMDANLKSKRNLQRLIIQWSSRLDDSRNETNQMDVLDSLQPHLNLNKLSIQSYGGPEFPRWIRDASFSKMVDLSLINCRKCTSLPCLGQLPLLKCLLINRMDGIKVVGAEFYGEICLPNNCFRSLESLSFSYLSIWEHWEDSSSLTESLFPCLRQLRIEGCPKLIKKLPTYLPSLTKLSIGDCPKLEFPLSRVPSLCELEVRGCNEVVLRSEIEFTLFTKLTISRMFGLINLHEGFFPFLRRVRVLKFWQCKELTYLWENGFRMENLHYLEKLVVKYCDQLVSLGEGEEHRLPSNLQSLKIQNCDKLERLPNGWQSLTCLGKLNISDCPKLVSFPEVGFPPMLRHLTLKYCESLKCLPNGMMKMRNNSTNTSSHLCLLEYLEIFQCPSLTCFPKGQLPTTLKQLIISHCENLKSLPEGMMHCNSTMDMCALEYLSLQMCSSLICFPRGKLPATLKKLEIWCCEKLESLPEGMMHPCSAIAPPMVVFKPWKSMDVHLSHLSQEASFPSPFSNLRLGIVHS